MTVCAPSTLNPYIGSIVGPIEGEIGSWTIAQMGDIVFSNCLTFWQSEGSAKHSSFARVHKSYLVNVNEVIKYKKGKGGSVVLSNGKEIMVSASKKADLLSHFK